MEAVHFDADDIDFKIMTKTCTQQERITVILHFKWGMTLKEVGEILNLSEGRTSQILKECEKKLGKRFGNA